ncbi:DNA polymerase Y family protein [Anaerostipes faecis]|uniref:DNA polymerase Y family protein n=1 Tax=Anaerostipes faecis TaxID=2880702 RepID=UPI0011DD8B3C|nr:DNA polymerase IV [Anaerostipes faecis]
MNSRVIFHIDVNSAYLSWEAVYGISVRKDEVDLREVPSIIGGDESRRRGIVLAASIPARKKGIQTAETVREALSKCPDLIIRPPCHGLYEKFSEAFLKEALEFSPVLEKFSIDEVFLDMTETAGQYESPYEAACLLKDRIYEKLGFTVNIGVAPNKLLAKMASDFEKPNKVHTLFQEEISAKMWPLPVENLFSVGPATKKKLHNLGIRTIGELAHMNPELLKSHIGNKHGMLIYEYANGIDRAPVEAGQADSKGYGNSVTLPSDVDSLEESDVVLLSLAESVASRLRADRVKTSCITVEIKDCHFRRSSHQRKLSVPTDITDEIVQTAKKLYRECFRGVSVRLIGLRASDISSEEFSQMDLFGDQKKEKLRKLDQSIDAIRSKYGRDAVQRATFLGAKTD